MRENEGMMGEMRDRRRETGDMRSERNVRNKGNWRGVVLAVAVLLTAVFGGCGGSREPGGEDRNVGGERHVNVAFFWITADLEIGRAHV